MPNVYMNYTVYLTNDADYNAAMLVSGGSALINKSPRGLAGLLGISYPYPSGDLTTIDKTITFQYPFVPGLEYLQSPGGSTGVFVDDTVDYQIVPQNPGSPSLTWPPGSDIKYIWSGNIIKANGGAGSNPVSLNAIPQRRWIGGGEWVVEGEGGSGNQRITDIRDASRTIDGRGLALRGDSSAPWNRFTNTYRPALTPATSWERFYVRFRSLPTAADVGFWRCHGSPSQNAGFALTFTLAGEVHGINLNTISTQFDKGVVFTPVLNTWYLVDILLKYASGVGTTGIINIYINHVPTFQFTDAISQGLNAGTSHWHSDLGWWTGVDDNAEIDLDDWICADLPGNCDANTLQFTDTNYPIDWLMGSHVRRQNSVSITLGGFVGNLGVLNQGNSPEASLSNALVSNISGDTLESVTDILPLDTQDTIAAVLGPVASIIALYSKNAAGTDGKLGYKIAGGAAVLATVNQSNIDGWTSVAYLPSGLILPSEISPFSLVHTKSADANVDTTTAMGAIVEYIGVWGPEDYSLFNYPVSRLTNLHNCRYENTGWGYVGAVPGAPIYSVGGTYIGNGTYQEILLPAPCHFLWIRALTGGVATISVFGASIEASYGGTKRVIPNVDIFTDILGITKFSVSGNDVSINKNGITFQYIAYCDPGMRFNLCGEFAHNLNSATPKANLLIDPLFTPECGFIISQVARLVSATISLFFKGPAHAGNVGNIIDGTVSNNCANFAQGVINSLADLNIDSAPKSYSLWRTSEPGCAGVMVQVCSYTGDGNVSQVVPITPVSGRFPLFVMVIPTTTSIAFFRDPSHVGVTSSDATTTTLSNTAIMAVGVDEITVGATLNVLGRVYHVFALPGSDLGMLNGLYYNEICDPPIGPHIAGADLLGDIIVVGDGGVELGDTGADIVTQEDLSGIYTIVPNKRHDTLQDRLPGQPTIEKTIPNPYFKTGYIGG
jgi:hypothetical protein